MNKIKPLAMMVLFNIVIMVVAFTSPIGAQAQQTLEGVLSVIYADHPENYQIYFQLHTPEGASVSLDIPPDVMAAAGGITALSGAQISVTLDASSGDLTTGDLVTARSITVEEVRSSGASSERAAVLGAGIWLNLLCRFNGDAAESFTPSQITGFFTNSYPMLDHYWRQASYNQVSIPTVTTTTWKTLPQTRAYYVGLGGWAMLEKLFDDCTALHSGSVTFSSHFGINMFFNNVLDGAHHGGCLFRSLQGGASQCWRSTWLPYHPGIDRIGTYVHEMGHAYGLPHSNNSDGDNNPYDGVYDVMSGTSCAVFDPVYACLPPHISIYQKVTLGWIQSARTFNLTSNGTFPITLDRSSKPTSTNYYTATMPISATRSIYIEARRNDFNDYDTTLSNSGVILYDINTGRPEPTWQMNALSDGSSFEGPGIFLPGETFTDFVNGFSMSVNSQTADGYSITLYKGALSNPPDLNASVQSSTVSPGKATVTVRVRNNGSGTANNAYLVLDPPDNVYLNTISGTPNCYQSDVRYRISYLCSLGNLAPNAQIDIPLDLRPAINMAVNLSPVALSNEQETTAANNRTTATTAPVTALPDLNVQLTQSSSSVTVNQDVTYTYLLRNVSGANAQTVQFSASLPAGLNLQSWNWYVIGNMDTPLCNQNGQGVLCSFVSLGHGYQWDTYLRLTINARAITSGQKVVTGTVTFSGTDATPADNTASVTTTVGVASINATVGFQARPTAPNALLILPLDVTVTPSVGGAPVFNGTVTTDNNGRFPLNGLAAGNYNIRVKGDHTLSIITPATISAGMNNVSIGILKEGDANDDNIVTITDFSILASSFGLITGQPGFDARADFNGDGGVTITDFSMLASNFGLAGQN